MRLPKYLHIVIYLTYECNLRCSYCVITFEKIRLHDAFIQDIADFIEKNRAQFDTVFVEFIGGEPLLQEKQIGIFLSSISGENIRFQITTNGTLITPDIYNRTIHRIDTVNLSYNENYSKNPLLFEKISATVINKQNVHVNFIYDPRRDHEKTKEDFLSVIANGYRNINILPIVLVHQYSESDFMDLIRFIAFVKKYEKILHISFLYYLQEKDDHFEFTVNPSGEIVGDNMGTAEEFFQVKRAVNTSVGKIGETTLEEILEGLKDYRYTNYLKNLINNGKTVQSYENLSFLSNLLKKYENETGK